MRKLTEEFALNLDIYKFNIQAKWTADLALLGKFNITKFTLTEGGPMEVDIGPGAFNEATEEVYIHTDRDDGQSVSILTGAFSNLPNLKKLTLQGEFQTIQTKAFSNLPKVEKIDLSGNRIKMLEDNTFHNLPGLVNIDLSYNKDLCHIGNLLYHQNLSVHLDNTNVNILLEDAFKPFLESVVAKEGKGSINIRDIKLQCGCDATWLDKLDVLKWKEIIKNGRCSDGTKLEEVDFDIHKKLCPPDNSPGYDAGYGQMYPNVFPSEDSGNVSSPEPTHYKNVDETYEIHTLTWPMEISFTEFYIKNGYVRIRDGDGTVLMEKKDGDSPDLVKLENPEGGWNGRKQKGPGNVTSNTNIVFVDFVTRANNYNSRTSKFSSSDSFKLDYQGKGGFVADRKMLCECCD